MKIGRIFVGVHPMQFLPHDVSNNTPIIVKLNM